MGPPARALAGARAACAPCEGLGEEAHRVLPARFVRRVTDAHPPPPSPPPALLVAATSQPHVLSRPAAEGAPPECPRQPPREEAVSSCHAAGARLARCCRLRPCQVCGQWTVVCAASSRRLLLLCSPASRRLDSAEATVVPPRGKALVKTDLSIAIPEGTYARIAPRSGLAWKHSIDTGAGVRPGVWSGISGRE